MRIFPRSKLTALVLSVLVTLGTPFVSHATEIASFDDVAKAGDRDALRTHSERILVTRGSSSAEKTKAAEYLNVIANAGDSEAQAILGKILIDGVFLPRFVDRGLALLESGVAAGNNQARITLAQSHMWGWQVPKDIARARSLLDEAVADGSLEAQTILGEELIQGTVFDRDIPAGRALLQDAVDKGYPDAKVTLGQMLLYGDWLKKDVKTARALFESAAEDGQTAGVEEYGSYLMWTERNTSKGVALLKDAGEKGSGSAWTTLAEGAMYGYLGHRQRRSFVEYAEKAAQTGDADRIAILEAERRIWGISMRASGPEAIAVLEKAAEDGNREALEYLIQLVRNGNRYNIRKRPEQARGYVERFQSLLTPDQVAHYNFSIDVAKTKQLANYARLAEELSDKRQTMTLSEAKDLYAANPNFVLYVLQRDMKRRSAYSGKLDGLATRKTINALWRECQKLPDDRDCGDDVLAPDKIAALLLR